LEIQFALVDIHSVSMGLFDMYQSKHTIRRNFPLLGRMRYLLEELGPEMRQYFIETDTDGKPFDRLQRSMVYQRSKKETSAKPFGNTTRCLSSRLRMD
jgi:glutamate synthase domain-containing protein 2